MRTTNKSILFALRFAERHGVTYSAERTGGYGKLGLVRWRLVLRCGGRSFVTYLHTDMYQPSLALALWSAACDLKDKTDGKRIGTIRRVFGATAANSLVRFPAPRTRLD